MATDENQNESGPPGEGPFDPKDLRRLLEFCWREAWLDYRAAGAPFGRTNDGFTLWIQYGERTTVN